MPNYDYTCKECGRNFQLTMTISEHDGKKVQCPGCRSESVEQRIAPFFARTSRKS